MTDGTPAGFLASNMFSLSNYNPESSNDTAVRNMKARQQYTSRVFKAAVPCPTRSVKELSNGDMRQGRKVLEGQKGGYDEE
jgi:hypothetical protein